MNKPVLDYYMHDGRNAFRFELTGIVNGEGARELEQAWRTIASIIGDRRLIIDISFVTAVDEHGRSLLVRWHREGAQFLANSQASRILAQSITGTPFAESAVNTHTSIPFRSSLFKSTLGLSLWLAAMTFPFKATAANLKSETIAAWNDYLATVNSNLQKRVQPGGSFLWTFENADRAAAVRRGEIVVAPAPGHNPAKVPGGLIHHWMGAMFLPGLKPDEVLTVTRDYDHYKEYYGPSVVESKTIARDDVNDKFSMLIMNKAFFVKTALDADYHSINVRLDRDRYYSTSRTTRVQEIEEYGQSGEHRMPEGEGGGYIWKLFSIARLDQRDGGVYVEIEAVALSRDIPAAARFFVDPIVRRVSRYSLLTSLEQTEKALRGNPALLAARRVGIPAVAGHVDDTQASFLNKSSGFTGVR
jgi:hypothetical protein